MTPTLWIFDALLAVTLVGLAARVLLAPDLFKAVVMFIVFGLLMAVAWTRLDAADIALAEAAIGAGVTGALLLNALGRVPVGAGNSQLPLTPGPSPPERGEGVAEPLTPGPSPPERGEGGNLGRAGSAESTIAGSSWSLFLSHTVLLLLLLTLGMVLGGVVWQLPREAAGLAVEVKDNIDQAGATNPVTAVLLNFRSYDTLLEIGVLLLAVLGVWSLGPVPDSRRTIPPGPVLLALVRFLVPVIGVIAAYLLWIGTKAPGGAFQAGAVLSAAGILLLVTGIARPLRRRTWLRRALLVLGFLGFLVVGVAVMAATGHFLEYPAGWASNLILVVEVLLTVSIAVTLIALFAGGPAKVPAAVSPEPEDA